MPPGLLAASTVLLHGPPLGRPAHWLPRPGGPFRAQAVIVVWGTFPQRVAVSGGVTYVAGEYVHDWLIGQRACLNTAELAALSAADIPSLFGSKSHLLQPDLPESRQPAGL